MLSEVREIRNRKFFVERKWALSELKALNKILKEFGFSNHLVNTIRRWDENKVKISFQRYKRLKRCTKTITLYQQALRYGKIQGKYAYDEWNRKTTYASTKEGMIERYGKEKAEEICYRKGQSFRNSEIQRQNSSKLQKKMKEQPDLYKDKWETQIGYWLKRGYSEEEQKNKVSERQQTFTLEKCIEKHGKEMGTDVWRQRQDKWQETLNSKSIEEIEDINLRRNPLIKRENETKEEFLERLKGIGENLIFDQHDLRECIKEKLKEPIWQYQTKEKFLESLPYTGNSNILPEAIIDELKFNFPKENQVFYNNFSCILNIEEGLLRSSHEINFYHELKKRNIEFELDKAYNDSDLKFDFYLKERNLYIEIQGMMCREEYKNKMDFKHKNFNQIIVEPERIQEFFEEYDNERIDIDLWGVV